MESRKEEKQISFYSAEKRFFSIYYSKSFIKVIREIAYFICIAIAKTIHTKPKRKHQIEGKKTRLLKYQLKNGKAVAVKLFRR